MAQGASQRTGSAAVGVTTLFERALGMGRGQALTAPVPCGFFADHFSRAFRLCPCQHVHTVFTARSQRKWKCEHFVNITLRLDRLRQALVLEWGELAARLGINRTMLHYLRKGQRAPSQKLERRIQELEHELGLGTMSPELGHAQSLGTMSPRPSAGTEPPANSQGLEPRPRVWNLDADAPLKMREDRATYGTPGATKPTPAQLRALAAALAADAEALARRARELEQLIKETES